MRRTTIAVFLLALTPASALACYDEHNAGWFNETPTRSWELLEVSSGGNQEEEMTSLWVIAAGTVSLALIGVSFRAFSRATDRSRTHPVEPAAQPPLALPFDPANDWTIRIDDGHQPGGPTRVARENEDSLCVGACQVE